MRFFDAFKMALHNIWHNKSRTALTLVIIFIVGSLLMVLNIFAIAFNENMNLVSREIFSAKGTSYSFSSYYDRNGDNSNTQGFTESEMNYFFTQLREYSDIFDSIEINIYGNTFITENTQLEGKSSSEIEQYIMSRESGDGFYVNPQSTTCAIPAFAEDGFILSGRPWNVNDCSRGGVWLTESYVEAIYRENGRLIKVGDNYGAVFSTYNHITNRSTFVAKNIKVQGIIDGSKFKNSALTSQQLFFFDAEFMLSAMGYSNNSVGYISMEYFPSAQNYDFNAVYSRIVALEKAMGDPAHIRQFEQDAFSALFGGYKRLNVEITSQMSMARTLGGFVIGFIMAISLLIVLLSVGSIANSVIISTDKNKKFIGLMKALGLKNKNVNKIINLEATVQIVIGVFVSFFILLALRPVMLGVLEIALGSLFRSMSAGVEYTMVLSMPFYVPLAVSVIFLSFALLSARGSLAKLAKMDVIAIMSEAA